MKPSYEELEARCAALAAENAGLKDINAWCKTDAFKNMYREFKTAEAIGCHDVDCMHDAMLTAIMHAPKTPATDAFLAEVRAQGLNAFIQHRSAELDAHIKNGGEQFDEKSVRIRDIIVSARLFREQIRKEALTAESARESGNIMLIIAARMARRELFTPLHCVSELPQKVVSMRVFREALERSEETLQREVCKIVDGHDRLQKKLKEAEAKLEAAEKRIAELERSELQLIDERDNAESALADMYQAATGERPEWSNMFGFADAVEAVEDRLATLESGQDQPVMFIDGDISSADADKLVAVIREFSEEAETPAARMARIIRENPHPTNMCDMPTAAGKGE